jgi:hypothetical protein
MAKFWSQCFDTPASSDHLLSPRGRLLKYKLALTAIALCYHQDNGTSTPTLFRGHRRDRELSRVGAPPAHRSTGLIDPKFNPHYGQGFSALARNMMLRQRSIMRQPICNH